MTAPARTAVRGSQPDRQFAHLGLLYGTRPDYLAGVTDFLRAGLDRDEPLLVAVPGDRHDALRERLGAGHTAVRWLDMSEAGRNPGRILPRVLLGFAEEHGGRRVRMVGEPVWPGRSAEEYPACVQHEALINHAFDGLPASILCPYDAAGLDATALADAGATHPLLSGPELGGRPAPSPGYAPDAVLAQANISLGDPPAGYREQLVELETIRLARRLATGLGAELGLSRARLGDLALVVTELVTNGVEHGGGTSRLRVWDTGEHLVCETHDHGALADPLAGRIPARPGQRRGFGLLLVNEMADLVRTHTTATTTTFRVYFRRSAE
ncbi:MAG TPA: sensor histidine kinase [Pseudonocardiaceae bacterium]|jgi:anti-sigma regulatory factor (Ser/Thr protein kinase)|nr:sensor histidine kinase [Pseudonocardiaceae bacterium]